MVPTRTLARPAGAAVLSPELGEPAQRLPLPVSVDSAFRQMRGSFAIIATSLDLDTLSPLHSLTLPSVMYLFIIQPGLRSILCEHGSGAADPVMCDHGAHSPPHTPQRLLPGKRLKVVQPREQDGAAAKLKAEFPYDLATPLLGKHPQRIKSRIWESCLHTQVHSNDFHSHQEAEAASVSMGGWMTQ